MKKNKIPMDITIETRQRTVNHQGEDVSESAKTRAFGFLKKTKKGLEIEYVSSDSLLSKSSPTTVALLNDNIIMFDKFGLLNTYMVFENGKSHTCVYETEPTPLQLNIRTKRLKNSISQNGGRLDIDYTVQIAGTTAEHSHIIMTAVPHENTITS